MKFKTSAAIVLAIIISYVTSTFVYFGYVTNYSRSMLTRETFIRRLYNDVFKYRIISRELLLKFDSIIDNTGEAFYNSLYLFNTFFLILTSIAVVLLIQNDKVFSTNKGEKYFIVLLVPIIINISQFSLTPYDISSYFFQLLILFIFLNYYATDYFESLSLISILLILSTLNRESSALSVAILLLLVILKFGLTKRSILSSVVFVLSFVVPYIVLRATIKDSGIPALPNSNALVGNLLAYPNIVGILFWIACFYFTLVQSHAKENKYLIILFHVLSLPYIFTVFQVGVLWEVRLYIPLFIVSLLLSKIDTTDFRYSISAYLDKKGFEQKLD